MNSSETNIDPDGTTNPGGQAAPAGYVARVARGTLAQAGARIGLAWIALLTVVAVLAPLLANSRPLLMKANGAISLPAIAAFTVGDWTLLALGAGALVAWRWQAGASRRVAALGAAALATALLAAALTTPENVIVHERYRALDRSGVIEWQISAPIPYSPRDYLRDLGDTGLQAPLASDARWHLFGTDELGADVASRMIHATRIALGIGLVATGIAMFIGVILGGLMGYFSGIVDLVGMRLVEIFEAVPTLFLLLTFVAFFGRSLYLMMVIIGITSWTGYARFVRAEFLRLREQDFVQAAEACGLPLQSILFRHMLPNGVAPVLVAASFGIASAILAEATLSFLGLGVVDDPSWGEMLNQAVRSSTFNWWMAAFPGGAIFATVFAYNLIGESLRDALDPRTGVSG